MYIFKLSSFDQRGFPCGSDGKESACDVGDQGSIPGSGRYPGEGHGNPLQYSCLENPMDRGAWWATVHGVTKSQIQLSDWAHTQRGRELPKIWGLLTVQWRPPGSLGYLTLPARLIATDVLMYVKCQDCACARKGSTTLSAPSSLML